MRIMVAIPCMDSIDADFVQCLVNMNKIDDTEIHFSTGSLVYVSRERLAQKAIAMNFDYVLWLDSDMIFNPELLADMMDNKKEFLAGLCFRRRPPFTPVIYSKIRYGATSEEYVNEEYLDYPMNSVFEVDGTGFGAVLLKTDVLKEVYKKYKTCFEPMRGYGEDLSFCIRARQCGFKIWCDSKVKIGHVTKSLANEESYLALKARAEVTA
jgi:GT2 family glycosyltransferase